MPLGTGRAPPCRELAQQQRAAITHPGISSTGDSQAAWARRIGRQGGSLVGVLDQQYPTQCPRYFEPQHIRNQPFPVTDNMEVLIIARGMSGRLYTTGVDSSHFAISNILAAQHVCGNQYLELRELPNCKSLCRETGSVDSFDSRGVLA